MANYEVEGEYNAIQIFTDNDKARITTLDPMAPCDYQTAVFTAAQIEELIEALFDAHTHLQAAKNAAQNAWGRNYGEATHNAR